MFRELFRKNKYLALFLINVVVMILGLIVGLPIAIKVYGGSGFLTFVKQNLFSDFGQVLYFSLTDNPYVSNFPTIYLPLTFLFVKPFALICKGDDRFFALDNLTIYGDGTYNYQELLNYNSSIIGTWQFLVAFLLFFGICLAVIGLLLYKLRKWDKKADFIFAYSGAIISSLIMFGIVRGTNVFLGLIFILLFIKFYKSEKWYLREISYVCLAIAGMIKIYPLLFGVLLLKEKKFLESLRVALYFAVLAIIPFAFYEGGLIANLQTYVGNVFSFTREGRRMREGINMSVVSLFNVFFNRICLVQGKWTTVVGYVFTGIFLAMVVFVSIRSKLNFMTTTIICMGMLVLFPVSYYYIAMFMVIPLLYLIDEWKDLGKNEKIIYAVFYGIISFLPLSVTAWYIPQTVIMLGLIVWETYKSIKEITKDSEVELSAKAE